MGIAQNSGMYGMQPQSYYNNYGVPQYQSGQSPNFWSTVPVQAPSAYLQSSYPYGAQYQGGNYYSPSPMGKGGKMGGQPNYQQPTGGSGKFGATPTGDTFPTAQNPLGPGTTTPGAPTDVNNPNRAGANRLVANKNAGLPRTTGQAGNAGAGTVNNTPVFNQQQVNAAFADPNNPYGGGTAAFYGQGTTPKSPVTPTPAPVIPPGPLPPRGGPLPVVPRGPVPPVPAVPRAPGVAYPQGGGYNPQNQQ